MPTILTLTANPLLDHLATGVVQPGAVNRVDKLEPVAGGKGLNVARILARHGHRVIAAGFLGGLPGERVRRLVEVDGIEPAFTAIAADTRIGFLIADASGGSTSLMERGPAVRAEEMGQLLAQLRERIATVDVVIASGGVPSSACVSLYRLVLDLCAQQRVPCWVDAYGAAMDEALAGPHPPDLAKPNAEEYGSSSDPAHRRWLSAREVHRSDGSRTATAHTPWGSFRIVPPTLSGPSGHGIGSGDCYVAALAHARLSNWPIERQLAYASAAGAANAARTDVARITPDDIEALVPNVQIERV